MLVLSRKLGESLVIGHLIEVEVVEIHGNKVRLGIVAPREVSVNRKEVELLWREEQAQAQPQAPKA